MEKDRTSLITLPEIIGLPPWNIMGRTNEQILNTMPIAEFSPHRASFKKGIDLMTLKSEWSTYVEMLKNHGFAMKDSNKKGIKFAFLADSFPTDSFQNEYGENFLQSMTEVISEKGSSIAQFFGATSASEVAKMAGKGVRGALGGGAIGKGFGAITGGIAKGAQSFMDTLRSVPGGSIAARGLSLVDRLLVGSRIDFPQVWKTSSFSPSYTMTIRLYNPNPRSDVATMKYIVGPIAALMLLGLPISPDGSVYRWPFLHKIKSTGIYILDPAFISNVTIIKGGDQQQISYNQRLGLVDVRLDFGSLYSTIVAEQGKKFGSGRPTLRKYLDELGNKRPVADRLGETILDGPVEEVTANRAPDIEESDPANPDPRIDQYNYGLEGLLKKQGGLTV